ncbi:hypothetical protein RND71_035119 [Anisodus tanguticus]|uniref:Uncharacterized protein n=1 Tax=Anisodus tanguticus TaxID=243964 RepID=A0AAE1R4Y1_9SOLA|nr:hypothetical protein RND71_035119 [Anisodus tanguticus]
MGYICALYVRSRHSKFSTLLSSYRGHLRLPSGFTFHLSPSGFTFHPIVDTVSCHQDLLLILSRIQSVAIRLYLQLPLGFTFCPIVDTSSSYRALLFILWWIIFSCHRALLFIISWIPSISIELYFSSYRDFISHSLSPHLLQALKGALLAAFIAPYWVKSEDEREFYLVWWRFAALNVQEDLPFLAGALSVLGEESEDAEESEAARV